MKIPDIKKIFNKKPNKNNHSFIIMRPNHDWKVIVYAFASVAIIFLALSFYFFDKIKKDDIFNAKRVDTNKPILVNQVLLDKILNEFSEKEKKINNFPKNDPFLTDPSK